MSFVGSSTPPPPRAATSTLAHAINFSEFGFSIQPSWLEIEGDFVFDQGFSVEHRADAILAVATAKGLRWAPV